MKKNKTVIILLLIVSLVINIASCGKHIDDSSTTNIDNLIYNDSIASHEKRLFEYETPYTLCYQNQDGSISLYLFPSPISYKDEQGNPIMIDTSLVNVEDKGLEDIGYVFQTNSKSIISYYPKQLSLGPIVIKNGTTELSINAEEKYQGDMYVKSTYLDLLGTYHDSISYINGNSYKIEYVPTSTGTTVNITLKEKPIDNKFSFFIDNQQNVTLSKKDKIITIVRDSDQGLVGSITQSFLSDSQGNVSFDNDVLFEETSNQSKYTIVFDDQFLTSNSTKYPVSLSVSFDFIPNMLTNITNYTHQSNDALSNYSVIGHSDCLGNGSLYLKYRIGYFVKSYEQNVKCATYNFVCLAGDKPSTVVFERIRDFWDIYSHEGELPEAYMLEGSVVVSGKGHYSVDITNFIKACIYDDTLNTEDYGLMVSNDSEEIKILSNYNNSLYTPYVRIDFYDLPWTFEDVDKINPST